MALAGCGEKVPEGARVVSVAKQDLVLDVEVTGTLKSLESVQVGPPAQRGGDRVVGGERQRGVEGRQREHAVRAVRPVPPG